MKEPKMEGKLPKPTKGHSQHRSGSGQHHDRRLKRQKTRQKRNGQAVREWQ